MSFTRRTFLLGAGSGLSLLLLTACTDPQPVPTPTATPVLPPDVPRPSAFVRSTWATDPFSRGAVSYLPAGSLPQQRQALAQPLMDRVFFAGEAVSDAPGTVRGALQSADTVAAQVLDVAGENERIAVIGAGAAGATTARILAGFGHDVVVLEARDRVGGRIHSMVDGDDAVHELGAWRFWEAADDELLTILNRLDIPVRPLGTDALYRDDPTTEVRADAESSLARLGPATVAAAVEWAIDQQADVTIADALDGSGEAARLGGTVTDGIPSPEALAQYTAALATIFGADADVLSSWFFPTELLTDTVVVPTEPLVGLVDAALEDVDVFLSTAVTFIAYADDAVSLRTGTGESLTVDRVVVTAPLGVLQEGTIEFEPRLPLSHRGALNALGNGQIELVYVTFDEPFWSTDAAVWNVVGTSDPITTWINLQPLTGEPTLIGVVGASAVEQIAELDDTALLEAVAEMLRPFVAEG